MQISAPFGSAITGWRKKRIKALRKLVRRLGWKTMDERLAGFVEFGYWPHLRHPRSFNEKLAHRKLFDRNPLFVTLADKVAVRDWVQKRLAPEQVPCVPLLGVYDHPGLIPWETLPRSFVVKTNHRSQGNILVPDKSKLDVAEARKKLRRWFDEPYDPQLYEWFYDAIPRKILVEELLHDPGTGAPRDIKFHTFHGRVEVIEVIEGLTGDSPSRNYYDREWNLLPMRAKWPNGPPVPRPGMYPDMIRLAEKLAAGLDFVRVDFLAVGGRIYLGEMTLVPGSGRRAFHPDKKYDFWMGAFWTIEH